MSLLRRNVVANSLGQSVGMLSGLLLVPLYSRYLGKEGFGLVGFFISLQALAAIFDLGLGAAANREVSRLSIEQSQAGAGRHLVRTLEYVYFGIALLLFASLALVAGWIAYRWIRTDQLDPNIVSDCVVIAALTIAIRLQGALYYGVMRGLEQQVRMNLFYSAITAFQTLGIALILFLLKPSIREFFLYQLTFSFFEIAALRHLVWRELRAFGAVHPRFQSSVIREIWRYALSVNGITVFAAGIKQIDKIVISTIMTISYLGYYSAASLVANGIGKVAVPFQTALFPRFAKLFAQREDVALIDLFRDSVRLLSFLSCAVAAGVAFFARDILLVWMPTPEAATEAATALSVLAVAMMLNGIMAPVFSMILATGHTQISLIMNGVGFAALVPLTVVLVDRLGLVGAAAAWLVFNCAYYLIVPIMLSRKWPSMSLREFYFEDSLPFLLLGVGVFAAGDFLSANFGPHARIAAALASGGVCLGLGVGFSSGLQRAVSRSFGPLRA